ncbi:MAG: hypothetical protein ACRD11_07905 [Terriglobia bacterium]
MKYERFEDLPVWRVNIDLASAIYALTDRAVFKRRYSLRTISSARQFLFPTTLQKALKGGQSKSY